MLRIAAYEYIAPQGRYAINWRLYGRWRARGPALSPQSEAYETPQQALQALIAQGCPVPPDLADWTALQDFAEETLPAEFGTLDTRF